MVVVAQLTEKLSPAYKNRKFTVVLKRAQLLESAPRKMTQVHILTYVIAQ